MDCFYLERVTLMPPASEGKEDPVASIVIHGCRYPENNWPARGSKTCPLEEGGPCHFEGGPFEDIKM